MRTLIAIQSYAGDAANGNHDLIRETWGKDFGAADVKFFIGRRGSEFISKADEVLVDFQRTRTCRHEWWESYKDCCQDFWQVQARDILRWSIKNGYDYTFLCSTDTYLIPKKLMSSGFQAFDYSGHFVPDALPIGLKSTYEVHKHFLYPWAEIGCGMFLSKKASETVLKAPGDFWYTDVHIGQILGAGTESGQILSARLENFANMISWHFRDQEGTGYQTHGFGWMKKMYQEHRDATA